MLRTGGSVLNEEGKASPAHRVTAPSRSGKTEPRRDRVQAEDWLGAPSAEGPGSGHTRPVPGKQAAGLGIWQQSPCGSAVGGKERKDTDDGTMPASFRKATAA